jgi:hypothetical protein
MNLEDIDKAGDSLEAVLDRKFGGGPAVGRMTVRADLSDFPSAAVFEEGEGDGGDLAKLVDRLDEDITLKDGFDNSNRPATMQVPKVESQNAAPRNLLNRQTVRPTIVEEMTSK